MKLTIYPYPSTWKTVSGNPQRVGYFSLEIQSKLQENYLMGGDYSINPDREKILTKIEMSLML